MKLLTITVPCYNSQEYMEKCVDSLLAGGDDVEILIIDDGSTDDTGKIADGYAERYPDIVRAIHQEKRRAWTGGEHRACPCQRALFQSGGQ